MQVAGGHMKVMKKGMVLLCVCFCFFLKGNTQKEIFAENLDQCTTAQSDGIQGFYEEKENSLDILFLGDSNFTRSINPLMETNRYHLLYTGKCDTNNMDQYLPIKKRLALSKAKSVDY